MTRAARAVPTRWGDWVAARARVVGFRRLMDLADQIGCRREQLSRWLQLDDAPRRMLKGFDVALARALQVDRRTLFTDYATVAPEAGALGAETGDKLRREVKAAADSLDGPRLQLLHLTCVSLLGGGKVA